MIKQLIRLANHLDKKGLQKEADYLDRVIFKLSADDLSEWDAWSGKYNIQSEVDNENQILFYVDSNMENAQSIIEEARNLGGSIEEMDGQTAIYTGKYSSEMDDMGEGIYGGIPDFNPPSGSIDPDTGNFEYISQEVMDKDREYQSILNKFREEGKLDDFLRYIDEKTSLMAEEDLSMDLDLEMAEEFDKGI